MALVDQLGEGQQRQGRLHAGVVLELPGEAVDLLDQFVLGTPEDWSAAIVAPLSGIGRCCSGASGPRRKWQNSSASASSGR